MEGIFFITARSSLAFDTCVSDTFDVIPAEDEEQDQDRDSIEHGTDQSQVPLRLVLLLKDAQGNVQNIFIRGIQVEQRLQE